MWSPCLAPRATSSIELTRFGHTATPLRGRGLVVYGGVAAQRGPDGAAATQRALGDVLLLPLTWKSPGDAAAEGGATTATTTTSSSSNSSSSDTVLAAGPPPPAAAAAGAGTDGQPGDGSIAPEWRAPDIIAPAGGGPGPRAFHSAAQLGAAGVAVFGGHILTLEAGSGRKRRVFFNDMWLLDTDDWEWRRIDLAAGSPSPPKRDMASLATLPGGQRLLLFGGRSEQQRALNDCWLFDAQTASWSLLHPDGPAPPPRKMAALAVLSQSNAAALHAATDATAAAPADGSAAAVVTGQPAAVTAVVFGGERDSGLLDDCWSLDLHLPAADGGAGDAAGEAVAGGSSGGKVVARWTQLRPRGAPPPRFGHALIATEAPTPAAAPAAPGHPPVGAEESSAPAAARLFVFGGCLDQSTFPYLARSYVQTAELWAAELLGGTGSWVHLPSATPAPAPAGADPAATPSHGPGVTEAAAAAAPPPPPPSSWPPPRMCHTLTALPDGRALLLGGRWREGVCEDAWWFTPPTELPIAAPAAPRASESGTETAGAARPAAAVGGSLLQSLLQPLRPRDSLPPPPSPLPAAAAAAPTASAATAAAALSAAATPAISTGASPLTSRPGSPSSRFLQANVDAPPPVVPASSGALPPPPPQQQQQQQQAGAAGGRLADWGEIGAAIRNPAAALSSFTARLGTQLQPGLEAFSQRLPGPAALLNLATGAPTPPPTATPALAPPPPPPPAAGPLAALRAQMGLVPGVPGAGLAAPPPAFPGGAHLTALASLGRRLLSGGDASTAAVATAGGVDGSAEEVLGAEVLISAARQRLMGAEVDRLDLGQVALMAADYAALASFELGRRVEAERLPMLGNGGDGDGSSSADMAAAPPPWPTDDLLLAAAGSGLRLGEVALLQARYSQLLAEA